MQNVWQIWKDKCGRLSTGTAWILRLVKPFTEGLFGWGGELPAAIVTGLAAWAVLWAMCFWLYRRKILIKI